MAKPLNRKRKTAPKESCDFPIWTSQSAPCSTASDHLIPPEHMRTRIACLRASTEAGVTGAAGWRDPGGSCGSLGGMAGTICTVSAFIWPHDASADFTGAIQRHCFEVVSGRFPPTDSAGIPLTPGSSHIAVEKV